MKALIIGNGQHTNRRIVPALNKISNFKKILITDRNTENKNFSLKKVSLVNYDYIKKSDNKFDIIIIATNPSSHIENIIIFKHRTTRLLVEKPMTNDLDYLFGSNFKDLYKNSSIFEGLMYFHHPFYNYFCKLQNEMDFDYLESKFTIPNKLKKNDFRYNANLGGSSILDTGIYPISFISNHIHSKLNIESKNVKFDKNLNIDLYGGANYKSDKFKKINIEWGYKEEYKNYLYLKNKKCEIYIPFFFSKPQKFIPKVYINKSEAATFKNFDQFRRMYNDFLLDNYSNFSYSDINSLVNRYKLIQEIIND